MKNNRLRLVKCEGHDKKVVRARNRLIRLYNQVRKDGGWRKVAEVRDSSNQAYVYNFAIHGKEPPSPEERKACFLPFNICETCRRPIRPDVKTNVERKPIPDWMQRWRKLPKIKRDALIRGLMNGELTVVKKK